MISWFKKHFIPHEGNNNRPHFLHGENMRTLVVAALVIEIIAFAAPTFSRFNSAHFLSSVLPGVLDDLTNQNREDNSLPALAENPLLDKAAQLKADDMAANGYFAHVSPTGKTPWYWLDQAGYTYDYAGENLAVDFTDSKDVDIAWMNSPTHRANILKASYTEVGTGVATGTYQGKEAIFIAQDFGHPVSAPAGAAAPKVETLSTTPENVPNASSTSSTTDAQILGEQTVPAKKPVLAPAPVKTVAQAQTSTITVTSTTTTTVTTLVAPVVAPDTTPAPTIADKLAASPRHTVDDILIALFVIVSLALILNIFVHLEIQHPDLITNAIGVLVLIAAVYLANYYISHHDASVTTETGQAPADSSFEAFNASGTPATSSSSVPQVVQ